jgi:hypothetical protein
MKKLLLSLLPISACLSRSECFDYQGNFFYKGMSKAEVVDILGSPDVWDQKEASEKIITVYIYRNKELYRRSFCRFDFLNGKLYSTNGMKFQFSIAEGR